MTGTRFGLETVRSAVRQRVAETSLREVAAEIQMSFSGLRSFLGGGRPQAATRARLATWYVRSRNKRRIRRDDLNMAIALMSEYIRGDGHAGTISRRLAELTALLTNESRKPRR